MRRLLAALVATLTVLVGVATLGASAASAAGTGGIEVTPLPAFDASGRLVTSFHLTPHNGIAPGSFELRNLTAAANSAQIYGAAASESADGAVAVGDAASGSWLGVPDATITLAPHEVRKVDFTVHTSTTRTLGAVVVQVTHGTIVTRAATLVTIEGRTGLTAAGVATWIACVAGGLVLLVGAGNVVRVLGRRRRHGSTPPAGSQQKELASV